MTLTIAKATQVLTQKEEMLVAIDAGYVDRAAAQGDLGELDAVLAQF